MCWYKLEKIGKFSNEKKLALNFVLVFDSIQLSKSSNKRFNGFEFIFIFIFVVVYKCINKNRKKMICPISMKFFFPFLFSFILSFILFYLPYFDLFLTSSIEFLKIEH